MSLKNRRIKSPLKNKTMSLTLKESVSMYDRYCRRHLDTPTFEDFNKANYTCLPSNREVFEEYSRVLKAARNATGVPVTRRLPSLYHKLSGKKMMIKSVRPPQVQIPPQTASFKASMPPLEQSVKMNIRAPDCISSKPVLKEVVPVKTKATKKKVSEPTWTLESYKNELTKDKSILLKESGGHMVHLIPDKKRGSFESLACKLTKSTWETLRGKSEAPLKMRDGSFLDMKAVSLDEGDLAEFVQARKSKMKGPHFIRFSRI